MTEASVIDGISISGSSNTVAIRCANSSPSFSNIQIRCQTGFQLIQSSATLANILAFNNLYGVTVSGGNPVLTNVTMVKNSGNDIYKANSTGTITIRNSIIGNVNDSNINSVNSLVGVPLNTIFMDPDAGDYTLLPNGPALNTGDSSLFANAATSKDIAGNARLVGGQIDRGAYESMLSAGINVRYVKQGGTGNGSTWALASGNLQQMINESSSGQHVWVAAGTYQPLMSFNMKDGVKIYGGFPASGNPAFIDRDWLNNITTLTAATSGSGAVVRNVIPLTSTSLLEGFTITGANGIYGGGIQNEQSSPTFKNLIISGNSAIEGGGMYIYGGSPTIKNVIIKNNTASFGGGAGVSNAETTAKFTNVQITSNTNEGMRSVYSNVTLQNCTITDNTDIQVNNLGAAPVITNSIIWGTNPVSNTSATSNFLLPRTGNRGE